MRIVAVDPSRTALKVVTRLLEGDGHVVTAFIDGGEALDFIKSHPEVNALITSAELTTISGLELCWETRLLSGHDRAIYIILMSSNSEQKHLINALDSGADEFIRKPPAGEELYARLRSADRMLRLQRELIRLAMIDPLTGLFNRRAFFEKVEKARSPATDTAPTTAIIFDVDHFKRVNDTFGHDVGDQVLRAIGQELAAGAATVGRLGGEEFAIVLEGADLAAGAAHADTLRDAIAAHAFATALGALSVTCSFGVAERRAGETIDQLLKRADTALYAAKDAGRNRVVAAAPSNDDAEIQWSGLFRSDKRPATKLPDAASRTPPRSDPPAQWPGNVEESVSSPINDGGPSAGSAFVLDDEPEVGVLVCKVLQSCGAAARQFTAPEPFFAELKQSPPELVVLDLSLGQSDAVEIIRHLEANNYSGKVLLISGRDEVTLNEITQIGEKHGLAMLQPLKKPFRAADIKRRLADHVGDSTRPQVRPVPPAAEPCQPISLQISEALANNWLELWYQPKIDLKSSAVCGAEGLIRARHPIHGIVPPCKFLPPPGHPDYQPLTKFVIERALADWEQFAQQGIAIKLSVNAPVSVINTPAFVALIRSALPCMPATRGLTIEVTEDEVIRDSEWAREIATQLKLYNVDLSIDDFGSGYASLSRLNDLPFAEIKIDRSIVSGCAANPLKHSLCQTVVDLAHRFGATACGEGVERVDDLRALIAMQCDTAQGYLFAKPMPAEQITPPQLAEISRAGTRLREASPDHLHLARSA